MSVSARALRSAGLDWVESIPEDWGTPSVGANFEVQLGKMLNPSAAAGDSLRPYLRNINVQWDRIDLDDLPLMHFDAGDRARYALRPGDLLVCEGGEVGRAAVWDGQLEDCYYQKALHRVRPYRDDSTRFLMYTLTAAASQGVFENEGNTSTIVHLTAEKLRGHRFPWPQPAEQRAIADHLDAETARIEAVLAAHRRQLGAVAARKRAAVSNALGAHATARAPIRRLVTTVTSGPRGWSDLEVDEPGHLFLRIANVPADSIKLKLVDVAYIQAPPGEESNRCRVRPGDVLTTITAAIGQVAVIPPLLGEAYVSQHVALLRPDQTRVDPEWLALALWSEDAQRQLDAARYGGTKQQLSLDDLREVRVPLADLTTQRSVVPSVLGSLDSATRLESTIRAAVDLLLERRQALITAAVTGQLEIPGAPA